MKDLIKQLLRESIEMVIIHDGDDESAKPIDRFNNLYFQKLDSQGLGLFLLSRDSKYFSKLEKITNVSQLQGYKKNPYRIDGYVMSNEKGEKLKTTVNNLNEIIKLKYESIDLLQRHLIASIAEAVKKGKS